MIQDKKAKEEKGHTAAPKASTAASPRPSAIPPDAI